MREITVRWRSRVLAYTIFDKDRVVTQAAVVENKRLGAVLAHVREKQREASEQVLTRHSGPMRRENAAFEARRAAHEELIRSQGAEPEDRLPDYGKDRSKSFVCTRTVSKVLTLQHRHVRYFLTDQPDRAEIIGREVTLCEEPDGTVELFLDSQPISYRKTVLKEVPYTGDGRQDVRSRKREPRR